MKRATPRTTVEPKAAVTEQRTFFCCLHLISHKLTITYFSVLVQQCASMQARVTTRICTWKPPEISAVMSIDRYALCWNAGWSGARGGAAATWKRDHGSGHRWLPLRRCCSISTFFPTSWLLLRYAQSASEREESADGRENGRQDTQRDKRKENS